MVRKLQLCTNCLGMAGCCLLSGSLSAAGMAGCCLRRSGSQVAGERICGVGEQWGERAARGQHASLRAEEAGGGEEGCCGTVEECSGHWEAAFWPQKPSDVEARRTQRKSCSSPAPHPQHDLPPSALRTVLHRTALQQALHSIKPTIRLISTKFTPSPHFHLPHFIMVPLSLLVNHLRL